jgi:biopolymer transport protein ExbD
MLRANRKPSESIPTSSMADIAFLLLIFFLVSTVFPKDRGLALVLSEGTVAVNPATVIHFLVGSEDAVIVRYGTNPQSRLVPPSEVGSIWRSAAASRPGLIAAVKTGENVSYGAMMRVLDQLQAMGATRISLETLAGDGR